MYTERGWGGEVKAEVRPGRSPIICIYYQSVLVSPVRVQVCMLPTAKHKSLLGGPIVDLPKDLGLDVDE